MLKLIFLSFLLSSNLISHAVAKTTADNQALPDTVVTGLKPIYFIEGNETKKPVNGFLTANNVPGMRIVFYEKGKQMWSKNYGVADISSQEEVNSNTVFAAASVSKPLAAVAALKLVEDGLLTLDADVNKHLKGWKIPDNDFTKKSKVSLRHLIGHRSGFTRYFYSIYNASEPVPTLEQMLSGTYPSKDSSAKMVNTPGEGYKYSNTGYLILEKLIEDISGLAFEQVLSKNVLQPSGMKTSSFKQPMPHSMFNKKATGYSANGQPYPYVPLPFKALGGLWTTPDDLAQLASKLMEDFHTNSHHMLSQSMAEQVFNRGDNKLGFSLWNWKDDIVFRHTGHNPGFTSFMFGSVNKQQVLVVMANGDETQDLFDHLQRAIADAYHWDYFKSESFQKYTGSIPHFKDYVGQYNWDGNYVNFSPEKDGLYMQINNERHLLTPISDHEFLLTSKPLKIIFPEKLDGKLQEVVIWKANGDYSSANRQ